MKKYDSSAEEFFVIPDNVDINDKGIKSYRDTQLFKKLLTSQKTDS